MSKSDIQARVADLLYNQPSNAYGSKMVFSEVSDIQLSQIEGLMGVVVTCGVVAVVALGVLVWNNAFDMKPRFAITLCVVFVVTSMMSLLREKTRNAFLKVKNAGNRTADSFAQLNTVEGMAQFLALQRKGNELSQARGY